MKSDDRNRAKETRDEGNQARKAEGENGRVTMGKERRGEIRRAKRRRVLERLLVNQQRAAGPQLELRVERMG